MIKKKLLLLWMLFLMTFQVIAQAGFMNLPHQDDESAYISCNPTGDFGRERASLPTLNENNMCALISPELNKSPLNSPIQGFKLVGVQVADVEMEPTKAGIDRSIARLSEAIWRNQSKTECILATQLEMRDAPLANGQYFEINDIAHAGFAKKNVAIAYFHKAHSIDDGGNTEVLFRAGRAFTSAITMPGKIELPIKKNAPPVNTSFSSSGVAYSENWIDFTTDVSFKDMDGVTRAHSSIFYIKYACDARDPVSVPNAIRLRTTRQNEQDQFELAVPGLIPADGSVDIF